MSCKSLIGAMMFICAASQSQAQIVTIATNGQGSAFYSVGASLAGVMQKSINLTTRVQPMSGPSVYVPLINRGEIDFGLMNALDVNNAVKGLENYKGRTHPDLRLVAVLYWSANGMGVANDSPAKSTADLKGMRMATQFAAQATYLILQDAVLATGGLSHNDMKSVPVSDSTQGAEALGSGKVDTVMVGLGQVALREVNISLAARGGLRILPIIDTPEGLAAMRKVIPAAMSRVFQPGPGYPGLVGPTALMVLPTFLFASKHVSDNIVYQTAKTLYENKPALEASSVALKGFDPKKMVEPSDVTYHPGAEKFYREIGQWPPRSS